MDGLEIYGQSGEFGYNARIKYHRRLRHFDMEVRPSDGLALAVRLKAPVLAEDHLLSSADLCTFLSSLQDPCKGLIFFAPEAQSRLNTDMGRSDSMTAHTRPHSN
jgi:hypothetical protein